jgi:hypothetical protein
MYMSPPALLVAAEVEALVLAAALVVALALAEAAGVLAAAEAAGVLVAAADEVVAVLDVQAARPRIMTDTRSRAMIFFILKPPNLFYKRANDAPIRN